ncbi:PAS domain-containing sensor histidine kinase [Chitinophaga sp. S165]|uniref:PAS domain-containing sensor histidine kinase n=1 Tax=Chitinophaga sp. S165 TaxID=2135462 RepID=UPI000D8181E9|nr:PAS domain-containing sensor histidine kinase [Chitinophaga sp. S165]PWV57026.1 PAS domain S-box-containing protein [Chitinophaga sp. S165]
MNKDIRHLISKYFKESDLSPAHAALFGQISQLLEDKPPAVPESRVSTAIFRQLQAALNVFGICEANDVHKTGIPSLIAMARRLKKECADRIIRQQKLLREMKHLKTIQSLASAGSWELPVTNNTLELPGYWSDELYAVLGVVPGSVDPISDNYREYVHPDDRQYLSTEVDKAIQVSGRYDIEFRLFRAGDPLQQRVVREIGELVRDEASGQSISLIGVTFDISDIRNTERALFKANVELRRLFNVMEDVFFSVNMEQHTLLQMSPSCVQLYGYSVDEFFRDPDLWFSLIHDDDKESVLESNKRLSKGESNLCEYRIHHKNGQIRWLEMRITPTLGHDGLLVRIDGISSDITKRREAELALENSELKFRSLLENSNDAITVTSEELKFVFVTQSMSRMIGYSVEEITGTSVFDFIHPDDHVTVNGLVSQMQENPARPIHFEIRFRVKGSGWIWTEGSVTNHLDGDIVNGYIANFRDVTYKIRYRKALEASNNRLKKTNNELDRFVYSVSHDLRAPLASVLGLIEYTTSETADENVLQDLGMMQGSIEKLDRFILDILDYSRNVRLNIKVQDIDFRQLLTEIRDNLKFLNVDKPPIRFDVNIQEESVFRSDEGRISILLNNLISNAMRYYDPGKPEPFIEVNISLGQEGANITVKDNGIGIEAAYHQKIFDMFFRVSEKSNGSGLGLYLVKETIEKLKGRIDLQSVPGVGTTFNIFLPNLF